MVMESMLGGATRAGEAPVWNDEWEETSDPVAERGGGDQRP
jgi:hypothetical protein